MAKAPDPFHEFVIELFAPMGPVSIRRMFGGAGLYHDGLFFGVLDDDEVFFKVDGTTRPRYEARGSQPFAPMANEAPMRGYYQVPAEVLEDRDALTAWAREAVEAARAARTVRRPGARRKRRR